MEVVVTAVAKPYVTFLCADLRQKRMATCTEAMRARDGQWLTTAGLVLVRQRPGSAKGVVVVTIEDESPELASVGDRDVAFPVPHGRGDEFHHGSPGLDPRGVPKGPKPRDVYDPYGHVDEIKVKTRDFR
jgi:error-prone DNA polymerase